jgi:serine phosphatase RsbU (regulator of sigma subunit)
MTRGRRSRRGPDEPAADLITGSHRSGTGDRIGRLSQTGPVAPEPRDPAGQESPASPPSAEEHAARTGESLAAEVASLRFRLERLQRVSAELGAAIAVERVIDIVMNLVDVPVPSPARGLWLHAPGASHLELVATATIAADTAARFAHIALDADLPGAIAFREHRTIVATSRTEAESDYEELQGATRSAVGVVGLGYDEAVPAEDLAFLEAVAGQIAQTLVRVRLLEHERRRREELEYLADLTDAALRAVDYRDLMHRVTSAAVPMLGDWCSLHFLPDDGGLPHVAVAHVDPDKVTWAEALQTRYPYDPDRTSGVAAVIRSGETLFVPDVTEQFITTSIAGTELDPDEVRPIIDAFALTSVITVPLLTKRRTVGAIQFITAESGRHYTEDDVALAEAVAGRLAEALDSAWLADQHRHIAVTLQRALLPPQLPDIPGIDIAARYWPAGAAEVGGDFYDLFTIDERTWAVVIGDACGHGTDAAALTSIARHTIRAAARHGTTHRELMEWLNEAVLKSDRHLFCTACYATLVREEGRWLLRTAAAGHPLPIHVTATDATTVARPGTLLGAFDTVTTTTVDTLLAAGDTVVFYTDGVTDLAPPHGLTPEEMIDLVASVRHQDSAAAAADTIHASVLERVPESHQRDDIALIVLRVRSHS